jgi:hypothetical protein
MWARQWGQNQTTKVVPPMTGFAISLQVSAWKQG